MTETSFPIADGQGVIESTYERLMSSVTNAGRVPYVAGEDATIAPLCYADSTGRQVKVAASQAYTIRGYRWESGTDVLVLALAANTSGKTRIDRVVLRLDRATWTVRLAILQGTPADAPAPPSFSQATGTTGFYEVPIAQVTITSNAGSGLPSIAAGDVKTEHMWTTPRGVWGNSAQRGGHTAIDKTFFEVDKGRLYLGTDSGDILIGENGPWTKLAAAGGWTADSLYAQRVNGMTYFQAYIKLNVADRPPSTDVTVCVLPADFRPTHNFYCCVVMTPGQPGFGYFEAATGAVKVTAYPQVFPTGGILAIGPVAYPSAGVRV